MPLTLRNTTDYIAQFVVLAGERVLARIPGIAPNETVTVPTEGAYQVIAETMLEGNTYTSAPMDANGPVGFLAQVKQVQGQGTYDFEVIEVPSTQSDQMQFQKTCLSPVSFTLHKSGAWVQTVVVSNNFEMAALSLSETFYVHAVINGITTDTVTTTNPNAVITAVTDTSTLESGYFALEVG
ncbi:MULTISPECIES: hypothetical protein [unclassified Lysobacter]|uniref:hypothetical protein n=1 Tax=unclassified Lysobacter TaxID=2635362 RepID=UPI0006F28AF5|nr:MULTISPECIES: hypothetical protein [unclassified Lysobacter]KQZ55505.1 hypothetical protein ASD53_14560 [Lysobacter sp. Root559]KRC31439.1 hypothetical protein ASE10_17005 [Lysobacter sp. Root76]KRD65345.1 hypothetical protein ASE45_18210 [Lysobacter sp. Root96]